MIGWAPPTGADGADHGDGTVVDVVEAGAAVVVDPVAVWEGAPPQAARTTRRVQARPQDSDDADDRRRHLVLVSSTAHSPMGVSRRRGGRPLGPARPT